MKRSQTHVIDEEAIRTLRSFLPPSWVPNELHPDYGKDYLFEIVEDEELTGINFFIQLKGEKSVRPINGGQHVTFPLKKKHAIYYADKLRQPIFLVVVDVTKRVGFWLFLQKHLLEDWPNQTWRFQKTANVQLPTANTLVKTAALSAAIKQAHDFMAARRPAAIVSAIRAERQRMEQLDPRMEVRITATEQGRQIIVVPKAEPVEFTIVFKGKSDEVATKVDNLIGRGRPVSFQPDEIEIKDFPLLAEALKGGGMLVSAMSIPAAVSIIARDAAGVETGRLDGISGHVEGGPKECRFEGSLGNSPVNLSITAIPDQKTGQLRFGFDTPSWHGQSVGLLAYFPQIEVFFNAAKHCASLDLSCSLQGNDLFSATIPADLISFLKRTAEFLVILAKARELALHFKVNPPLPSDFGAKHGQEIERLYCIIKEGEYRKDLPGARITIHFSRVEGRRLLQASEAVDVPLEIHSIDEQLHPFLGVKVGIGIVKQIFTKTKVSTRRATLKRRIEGNKSGDCKVEFTCSRDCEQIVRVQQGDVYQNPGKLPEGHDKAL